MEKRDGFTLIEILIVIVIGMILLGVSISTFYTYRKHADLQIATDRTLEMFFEARAKTLSSQNRSSYGIHLQSDKAVIFKGITYSASDPNNIDYLFPITIALATTSFAGGGSNVVFKRLTGETDQFGTLVLRLASDVTSSTTISIASTGLSKTP